MFNEPYGKPVVQIIKTENSIDRITEIIADWTRFFLNWKIAKNFLTPYGLCYYHARYHCHPVS